MICTMVWPSQNRQKTLLYIMFLSNACSTKNTFRKFVDKADRFVTHLDRFIIGTPSERTPQGLCQSDATHKPGNQGAACTKETLFNKICSIQRKHRQQVCTYIVHVKLTATTYIARSKQCIKDIHSFLLLPFLL